MTPCPRHPQHIATEVCYICSKPICPKCMEVFGYVCSPLCKAKAASHGIAVPVFAGQKSVREARLWRTVRVSAWTVVLLAIATAGTWIWYSFFASKPRPVFSVRFAQPSYSGQSFVSADQQIIFLHGATLARHDMKEKKEIWSRELISQQQIAAEVAKRVQEIQAAFAQAQGEDAADAMRNLSAEKLARRAEKAVTSQLELRVRGQNIWVSYPDRLVRFDWQTGNPAQEIPINQKYGGAVALGDEFLVLNMNSGKPVVSHVGMATCESRAEELSALTPLPGSSSNSRYTLAQLGSPSGYQPLDPNKVAEQVRQMSLPARLALPAMLAARMNQERALAEMNTEQRREPGPPRPEPDSITIVPTPDGFVQLSRQLAESHIVERQAMKAPPARSAFEGMPSVAKSTEMINEMLNEMQRAHGGEKVYEDLSQYRVTLRQLEGSQEWKGDVIGPPALFPLKTVQVLAADNTISVFDKSNNKLWDASLTYKLRGSAASVDQENPIFGRGPCIEHDGSLYVADEGVLTAFDLATGKVRWRYPSVGISGLLFDEQGMIYVNTTTASPDQIKYSRQIDIAQNVGSVVLKLDPRTGITLWKLESAGPVAYVSGKFLYTVAFYNPDEEEDPSVRIESQEPASPWLRIRRISPKDGHKIWEHSQERAPLDLQFDKNSIRLIFKKEVQVLRFLSF
ncbi:MAG: hypothetical protein C5B50_04505 [Verrucomicrobia bacterium]|nr:MAG: hypothetical protein C5B50_04505 [Verrucomicrobiota bacterium]